MITNGSVARQVLLLLLLAAGCIKANPTQTTEACETLQVCLRQLHDMAQHPDNYGSTMSKEEQALIGRILAFDDAVPALIPLLADPDENVANIAAATLRSAKQIDPVYLPRVLQGLDRGLGWLPLALARIATPDAAKAAVDRYLVSKSAPGNQEAFAVEKSGKRAVPFIIERAACSQPCAKNVHYLLGAVLKEMNDEARTLAAPGLMEIASDPATPEDVARNVLFMISGLGHAGNGMEPGLLELRAHSPQLGDVIDQVLVGIGSHSSGNIFATWLRQSPSKILLRDLAETGSAAGGVGEVVVGLLDNEDLELRVAAARALGFINYEPGIEALMAHLDDPLDQRMTWAVVESLGRLHAEQALPLLDDVIENHWFPPVRKVAVEAAGHIREQAPYASKFPPGNFAFEFFAYQHMRIEGPECETLLVKGVDEPRDLKLYTRYAAAKLKQLSYTSTIFSYGPAERPPASKDQKIIEVTPENMTEYREIVEQVPHVALRVDSGWLAGSNRGEWGGELMAIGDDGLKQAILDQNVEDIYRIGNKFVAVVGLAHLSMNNGALVELHHGDDGRWTSEIWRMLPGAPISSSLVESGELLVTTYGSGSILVSPEGAMRMATCARYIEQTRADSNVSDDVQAAADAAQAAADAAAADN